MRKLLIPFTLLVGAAAGLARAFEFRLAWDTTLWLMTPWHYMSLLLLGCALVTAVVLFMILRGVPNKAAEPSKDAFTQIRSLLWADIAAALALLAGALFDMRTFLELQTGTGPVQELSLLIFAIFSAFTAISVIAVSLAAALGTLRRHYAIYMLTPVFWACFWLLRNISSYAVNPVPLSFLYNMMSIIFTLLTLYTAAGIFFYRANVRRTLLYGALGVFFSMISLLGIGLYWLLWRELPMGNVNWSDILRFVFALFHLLAILHAFGARKSKSQRNENGKIGPMYYPYHYPY